MQRKIGAGPRKLIKTNLGQIKPKQKKKLKLKETLKNKKNNVSQKEINAGKQELISPVEEKETWKEN